MSLDNGLDVERLATSSSTRFVRRVVELPPLAVLNEDGVDWEGAIVFVTAGEIELACSSGVCARFQSGDIVCFSPFPNRTVRNCSAEPARLLAIWRRLDVRTG